MQKEYSVIDMITGERLEHPPPLPPSSATGHSKHPAHGTSLWESGPEKSGGEGGVIIFLGKVVTVYAYQPPISP